MSRYTPVGAIAMLSVLTVLSACAVAAEPSSEPTTQSQFIELSVDVVRDKIQGGLLGQLLGNLNGLPYEFKFGREPGNIEAYTPSLADAYTDDDTDVEWVYIFEMQNSKRLIVPYDRITELWTKHINRRIWEANARARALMALGIEPPLTGLPALNAKAHYNISGLFVAECFGLASPAMPQTAARIGTHYTHVTIDGEASQATQLITAMIATAFVTDNIDNIIDAGLASVDPASQIHEIVTTTRTWCREHGDDWRATRELIRREYQSDRQTYPGGGNGYASITAAVVGVLLYGQGDLSETLRLAFNFGWDADNTAATAGTIIGVVKGRKWMESQGWKIGNVYRNTSRDAMPNDETITGFGGRIAAVAEIAITGCGGGKVTRDGKEFYRICRQSPANVEHKEGAAAKLNRVSASLAPQIAADLVSDSQARRIRAAYLGICLGLGDSLHASSPEALERAIAETRAELARLGSDKNKWVGQEMPALVEQFEQRLGQTRFSAKPKAQ